MKGVKLRKIGNKVDSGTISLGDVDEEGLKAFMDAMEPGKTIILDEYHIYDEIHKKSPLSVYYINFRSDYPDNYPAKFDEEFARFLVKMYSKPGEWVLDPMGGSGTIPLMALQLGREALYQDVNELALKLYREKSGRKFAGYLGDSSKYIECNDNTIDLIVTSPPFGLTIDQKHDKYSDNPLDLANSKDYEIWRTKMKGVLKECFRVLKPGHLCFIETRPRSKKGHSYPLNAWVTVDGMDVGFNYYCDFVEIVDTYRMWTFGEEWKRKPMPAHSNVVVLEKPEQEKLI